MDLRVVSTGHKFHEIDSKIAQLLLELLPAAVERIEYNKPAVPAVDPSKVIFGVRKNPYTGNPEIIMQQGNLEEIYSGLPDKVPTFGGKAQRVAPVEIIERYRAAYDANIADGNARQRLREGSRN